jgi:glucose-1-phosphate cytidylyltransferase
MKVVILAGGFGTRLSEETSLKPKPLVEIGGKPIIWHIMKIYSSFGFNEFIVCLGYKGEMLKQYFRDYYLLSSDIEVELNQGKISYLNNNSENWKVSLIDTGSNTMTGGRLLRLKGSLQNTFMLTYGDGIGNVNISNLIDKHQKDSLLGTVTAVQPPGRFGSLDISLEGSVNSFQEKPAGDGNWINGGFFVFEPEFLNYLQDDSTVLEESPLKTLASEGNLGAYKHDGYWRPMDTLRDKHILEEQWSSDTPPWKTWD